MPSLIFKRKINLFCIVTKGGLQTPLSGCKILKVENGATKLVGEFVTNGDEETEGNEIRLYTAFDDVDLVHHPAAEF